MNNVRINIPTKIILIFGVLSFFPASINAIPLAYSTISRPGYSSGIQYSQLSLGFSDENIQLGIDTPEGRSSGHFAMASSYFLFLNENLTVCDIGKNYNIDATSYAYWNNMRDYVLTDGQMDWLLYSVSELDSVSWNPWAFTTAYAGNGIDFQGYSINYLMVTINDIQRNPMTNYPDQWIVSWTTCVDGNPTAPVPEPATMLLLGAGLLGLAGFRNRLKR